jgi:hypothetical protein
MDRTWLNELAGYGFSGRLAMARVNASVMSEFGDAHGWVVRYIGDWNHPRQQRMLEYCIKST